MKVIKTKSEKVRIRKVKKLLLSAGNTIGSVWFKKRSDGTLRKMCYRLHTQNPGYAPSPTGKRETKRRSLDSDNCQITVLDCNKVLRRKGRISGRGAWRTIPLENVKRICVKGEITRVRF